MKDLNAEVKKDPFETDITSMFTNPKTKRMVQKYDFWIRWITGLKRVEDYNRAAHKTPEPGSPWCKLLKQLNIDWELQFTTNDKIPDYGAIIILSNHPFGMLDGITLASVLRQVRDDIKIMANQSLISIENLAPDLIGVDPYEHAAGTKANLKPLRDAKKWLQQNGLLAIFPGGDVSHLQNNKTIDCSWHPTILRFLMKSNVPILPVYFAGKNTKLFYRLRKINERLSSLRLGHELLKKRGQSIKIKVGRIIHTEEYAHLEKSELEVFLRQQLYCME